jgi:hypothetical protein
LFFPLKAVKRAVDLPLNLNRAAALPTAPQSHIGKQAFGNVVCNRKTESRGSISQPEQVHLTQSNAS